MAQLIPDKNLWVVTSALRPNMGAISEQDRFNQTMDTLKSLRKHCPNDLIYFTDGSPNPIAQDIIGKISPYCDFIACWNNDPDIFGLASGQRKSESEIVLLFKTLSSLKQNKDLLKAMHSVKRIFKYSARTTLHDSFDISQYDNLFGKYVFKTRMPSWMDSKRKSEITDHLFITRMFSLCPSLLDNYFETLQKNYQVVVQFGIDTEHAHYKNIDKKHLIEFETLHCEGIMAGTGATEKY